MSFKLTINHDKCVLCETCIDVCMDKALSCKDDKIVLVDTDCARCESCSDICTTGALKISW